MFKNKNFNIYVSEKDIVSNFTPVNIHQIDDVSNGSASNIICTMLDKISYKEKQNFVHILLNKLTKPSGKLVPPDITTGISSSTSISTRS